MAYRKLGTDLGVYLNRAYLLVLRNGTCLIAVATPEQSIYGLVLGLRARIKHR